MYNLILSIDDTGVIGIRTNDSNPKLAYTTPYDLKRFKTVTSRAPKNMKNAVVMGRNTWVSLNSHPLPGRMNIVLSSTLSHTDSTNMNDVTFVKSWKEVFSTVNSHKCIHKVFVIGGQSVYEEFLQKFRPLIDTIYITRFHASYYDTHFDPENVSRLEYENVTRHFTFEDEHSTIEFVKQVASSIPISYETWKLDLENSENSNNEEMTYLRSMARILLQSPMRDTRNGKVFSAFGQRFTYNLENGRIPVLTTKRVAWKTCIRELLWFLTGKTDNNLLEKQGVRIWTQNASRSFLDSRGLVENAEGDLGPVYGFQWRHAGATYTGTQCDYTGHGIDQIESCVSLLKTDPTSRRIIVSAWNVQDIEKMALPPCHVLFQWYVDTDEKLWLQFYQRSGDMFLGVPFNIMSYAVLVRLMCLKTGHEPGGLIHVLGDAHVYENHEDAVLTQIQRNPKEFPKLSITKRENWEDYTIDDFTLQSYDPEPKIGAQMSA